MKLLTIIMAGLLCLGMTTLAMANPAMLPKYPGYPSRGEFVNDMGRDNLTYSQSIGEAAKSGNTTMGTILIDPKNTGMMLEPQVVDSIKGALEPSMKEGIRIQKNKADV